MSPDPLRRSLPLLLPGPGLPRLWQAGTRQSDGRRPRRQDSADPAALLPYLQGPVLRTEGDTPVRLDLTRGQGHRVDPTRGRSQGGAGRRSAGGGAPRYRGPLQPTPGRTRPATHGRHLRDAGARRHRPSRSSRGLKRPVVQEQTSASQATPTRVVGTVSGTPTLRYSRNAYPAFRGGCPRSSSRRGASWPTIPQRAGAGTCPVPSCRCHPFCQTDQCSPKIDEAEVSGWVGRLEAINTASRGGPLKIRARLGIFSPTWITHAPSQSRRHDRQCRNDQWCS